MKELLHIEIKKLMDQGLTNPQIANVLKLTRDKVANITLKKFGGNKNYIKDKTKHRGKRLEVLKYFLSHTPDQCMEKFNLTSSEFKSLMTATYKMQEYKSIRKDNRTKEKWTVYQLLNMLKYCGILRRKQIAKIIKRGNERIVKEKLNFLKVSSRNINGVNITQFRKMFGYEPYFQIKGNAGPGSTWVNRFVIIPWWYVLECYKKQNDFNKELMKIFETYSIFNQFIWKGHPWDEMKKDKYISKFLFEDHNE